MAKQVVSLRLDEELLEWATGYAKARGVPRTELLEHGLRSFREDCESGVPELRAAAREQAALSGRITERGVGVCPERGEGLGHVWAGTKVDPSNPCKFCGTAGRSPSVAMGGGESFFDDATRQRVELFSRLRAPESAKGRKVKS